MDCNSACFGSSILVYCHCMNDYFRYWPHAEFYLQAPMWSAEGAWQVAENLRLTNPEYSAIHKRIGDDMILVESMIIADKLEF